MPIKKLSDFVNFQASNEDITNAYRRLSKIYHPDKHSDPDLKKHAEELFNKTRRFYDGKSNGEGFLQYRNENLLDLVLIDPQKRAIYDTIGDNLLSPESGGWEVVERHMSPTEIREEYERLIKMKEEQMMQQRTNPSVKFTNFAEFAFVETDFHTGSREM